MKVLVTGFLTVLEDYIYIYIYHMNFATYMTVSFITFFGILLVLFCIIVHMAVCFVSFCLILQIMCSYCYVCSVLCILCHCVVLCIVCV